MNNPAPATLRVLDGPDAGVVLDLQEGLPLRVGSSLEGDVAIAGLAPVHAEFLWRGGTLSLVATGPATVNGASLRKADLHDGDEVWLAAQMVFGVTLPAATAVAPAPIPVAAADPGWQFEAGSAGTTSVPVPDLSDPMEGLAFAPAFGASAPAAAPVAPPQPVAPPAPSPRTPSLAPAPLPAAPPLVSFDPGLTPTRGSTVGGAGPTVPRPAPRPASVARPAPRPRPQPAPARKSRPTRSVLLPVAASVLGLGLLGGGGYAFWATRPPVVNSIQPATGFVGDEIVIEGDHLESSATQVRFGSLPAQVGLTQRLSLRVKVPAVAAKGRTRLDVTVETPHGTSSTPFEFLARPAWDAVNPQVALPGDRLTLQGAGFDSGPLQVAVGGQAARVVESGPDRVVVEVPALQSQMSTRDPISVSLRVAGQELQPRRKIWLGTLPYIVEVSPRRVAPGEEVTVTGLGFDPAPGATQAYVAGQPALLLTVSETSLTLSVPAFPRASPDASVEVVAHGSRSVGGPGLQVERIVSGSYVLRFVAAVVPDRPDLADVVSEFSPVLRLASRGEAPDVRRRARNLASALNQMVAGAITGQQAALEVREQADGVWLAEAGGRPLTRVDAQDAEAYAPGLSPRALADHWAALLDDHLVLFVRRDRPMRMTGRSPLGRAMTDLQVALLRTRGAAIPSDAPERVPAALAARLTRMALEVPLSSSAPTSASSTTFEGEWQGELRDEALGGPQRISLAVRPAGAGLAGTLRMEGAAGSVEQPAQGLVVQGDRVSFRAGLRGAARQFIGTRSGSTLSGTVRSADGTKDEGRFELRLQIR
jgi:hypothetical protein